ncbi:MAG: hypothetical protein M1825_004549 [Sarcosagium campestre]|nr:MAG: hypothetical protein M1825_004549 [Sarcosagium campestre]
MDPLSPTAPARVRALLLPVGKIKRSSFLDFVQSLQREAAVVRLGDVSPDPRPNRTMFSPLAFPAGQLKYELSTSLPPATQLSLSPFELFRAPLSIFGIADYSEWQLHHQHEPQYQHRDAPDSQKDGNVREDFTDSTSQTQLLEAVAADVDALQELYPKALVHQILIFNYPTAQNDGAPLPQGIMTIPPLDRCTTTTIKTAICDLTSLLLAEMTTLAKSLQGLSTIESPTTTRTDEADSFNLLASSSSSSAAGRAEGALNATDASPSDDPRALHRMSLPVHLPSSASARSAAAQRTSSPYSRPRTPPAQTFDDMTGTASASPLSTAAAAARDERRQEASPHSSKSTVMRSSAGSPLRNQSAERVSVQGFGSGSVTERARNKGKGRVGIVVGAIYLQAGRWNDAVRELAEHTTAAKANSDHVWHAKGLENIMVALLMLAWAEMDVVIPPICYPTTQAQHQNQHQQQQQQHGATIVMPEKRPGRHGGIGGGGSGGGGSGGDSTDRLADRLTSLHNLATLLPDLCNMILHLYTRAGNSLAATSEALPQLAYSQCALRCSKLLAAMHLCGGTLNDEALRNIVRGAPIVRRSSGRPSRLPTSAGKTEIAAMVLGALPPFPSSHSSFRPQSHSISEVEQLSTVDRCVVLAGVAAVLSDLSLHRKKAMVLRELVRTLIPGLVQARKLGAAEVGIHPAAGLAALNAGVQQTGQTDGGSGEGGSGWRAFDLGQGDVETGIEELLAAIGSIYGVVPSFSPSSSSTFTFPQKRSKVESTASVPRDESTTPARESSIEGRESTIREDESTAESPTTKQSQESKPGLNRDLGQDSDELVIERITRQRAQRSFGNLALKFDVLRYCINLCEALPDFHGVLRFTSELLRTAGGGVTTRSSAGDYDNNNDDDDDADRVLPSCVVPVEEQVRLATNITRTVGAARKLGLRGVEAEYWDDVLVRGVEAVPASEPKRLTSRSKTELDQVTIKEDKKESKSPFIYNPFLKRATTNSASSSATSEKILVVDEPAEFTVTLQNPYDFSIEIEWLTLESSRDVRFEPASVVCSVGPARLHTFGIGGGVARQAGPLSITGCIVKVRGCRARRFPIFALSQSHAGNRPGAGGSGSGSGSVGARPGITSRPDYPRRSIKKMGLAASLAASSSSSQLPALASLQPRPQTSSLTLTVIDRQPLLVVTSTSLSQGALMLLEGEVGGFSVTLRNVSATDTPVDLLLFSFQDSATAALRAALVKDKRKHLSPSELYEIELQLLADRRVFSLQRRQHGKHLDGTDRDGEAENADEDDEELIPAGQEKTFYIKVLGRPGLVEGVVQIDYAHLGVPRRQRSKLLPDTFHTRQLRLSVLVTVNSSVTLSRFDVLPLCADALESRLSPGLDSSRARPSEAKSLMRMLGLRRDLSRHCLLSLDLYNTWPDPLDVRISLRRDGDSSGSDNSITTLNNGDPPSGSNHNETSLALNDDNDQNDENATTHFIHTDTIQPGHTKRIILPIRRILLANPLAPIPILDPANKRQFVVSNSNGNGNGKDNDNGSGSGKKDSLDNENAQREAFWFREAILNRLSGEWKQQSNSYSESPRASSVSDRSDASLENGRRGTIDLRAGTRLRSSRIVQALKEPEVEISFFSLLANTPSSENNNITNTCEDDTTNDPDKNNNNIEEVSKVDTNSLDEESPSDTSVQKKGNSTFSARAGSMLTAQCLIRNRTTTQTLRLILRLRPSLRELHLDAPIGQTLGRSAAATHGTALDLSKRLAWHGALQRPLPVLQPGEATVIELGLCALCAGEFEVGASVEELVVVSPPPPFSVSSRPFGQGQGEGGGEGSVTGPLGGENGRRMMDGVSAQVGGPGPGVESRLGQGYIQGVGDADRDDATAVDSTRKRRRVWYASSPLVLVALDHRV